MKAIFIFLITFTPLIVLPQRLKSYSGDYEFVNPSSNFLDYGKANYTYYENDESERVKDGRFIFNGNHLKIVGYFKNGLRDSIWKVTYQEINSYKKVLEKMIVVTVNYKNGKLNGKCSLTVTEYPSKKIIESSYATFKENRPSGSYFYFRISKWDKKDNVRLKFDFDSSAKLHGEYTAEYYRECCIMEGDIEEVLRYDHGQLLYRLCREKVNGKIYYRFKDGKYTTKQRDGIVNSKSILSESAEIGANIWILDARGGRYNPLYVFLDGVVADFEIHDQLLDLE